MILVQGELGVVSRDGEVINDHVIAGRPPDDNFCLLKRNLLQHGCLELENQFGHTRFPPKMDRNAFFHRLSGGGDSKRTKTTVTLSSPPSSFARDRKSTRLNSSHSQI